MCVCVCVCVCVCNNMCMGLGGGGGGGGLMFSNHSIVLDLGVYTTGKMKLDQHQNSYRMLHT